MKFFEPSREWIDWLIAYANNRPIVDVGCGEGQLLIALQDAGYDRTIGIDPYVTDEVFEQLMQRQIHCLALEAEQTTLLQYPGQLVVFARPCHSGFMQRALEVTHPENEVLYISKPYNVWIDVEPPFEVVQLDAPPCRVEQTYRVSRASVVTGNLVSCLD